MLEWMLMPYRRYADFSGRSQRKEYWMFVLLFLIVYAVCFALMFSGGYSMEPGTEPSMSGLGLIGSAILGLFVLGSLIPALAVQVRRFHDQDKSGWFVLLAFIPIIGGLVVFVFMCIEGTRGPNRFGQDPKDSSGAGVFS